MQDQVAFSSTIICRHLSITQYIECWFVVQQDRFGWNARFFLAGQKLGYFVRTWNLHKLFIKFTVCIQLVLSACRVVIIVTPFTPFTPVIILLFNFFSVILKFLLHRGHRASLVIFDFNWVIFIFQFKFSKLPITRTLALSSELS